MEARIKNEIDKYIREIETGHQKILGETFDLISQEQREQIRNLFTGIVDTVIELAKQGRDVHERFLQQIVLNSIDAIIGLDNDDRIFFWNRGAEIAFGYRSEEITGHPFTILVPQRLIDSGELEKLREMTYRVGYIRDFMTERVTKSGKTITISLSRTLLLDHEQKPLGYVAILRDISDMLLLQQQVQQSEKFALIGELAAGIAHEVGTPLNIISGTAEYLKLGKKASDPEVEELQTIIHQIDRIEKLIRQLLTFARPQHIEFEDIDLSTVIDSAISFLHSKFERHSIHVDVNLQNPLAPIHADRNQLQQVLINLLVNACDALSAQNGKERKIIIRGYNNQKNQNTQPNVVIEIEDNGCGIAADNLSLIFNPFFTTKEIGRGTGLGLAVSKRIIEDHGGTIDVKSHRDIGTTFAIQFPIK